MGFGKFLKKTFKAAGDLTMKVSGMDWAKDQLKDMLGLNAMKDLAGAQEAQLRQQQEANKLDASVESQNVAQFDTKTDSSGSFTGTDSRRKKKQAGAYSQALGLQL